MNKLHKSLLIGVGALVLSTVAIQASDIIRGVEGNLSGLVLESQGVCGEGAVQLLLGSHALCVDVYEASPSSACPHADPESQIDTQNNANVRECVPESKADVVPWRFVSLTQAQQLCARTGKRLPTNEEWYKAVSGSVETDSCAIDTGTPSLAGNSACITPSGIHDMIGNVWEWVDETVTDGQYDNRALPQSGYVALVDGSGVVLETAVNTPSSEFGEDYAWVDSQGVRGVLRGGFYGSGNDAGIFAQNLSVPLDFRSAGVGFRCVKDI